jgi:hypothetical protein
VGTVINYVLETTVVTDLHSATTVNVSGPGSSVKPWSFGADLIGESHPSKYFAFHMVMAW